MNPMRTLQKSILLLLVLALLSGQAAFAQSGVDAQPQPAVCVAFSEAEQTEFGALMAQRDAGSLAGADLARYDALAQQISCYNAQFRLPVESAQPAGAAALARPAADFTRTVGGGGDYGTLKAAFDAINAGTLAGALELNVIGDTTETEPAVLNANGSGSANFTSVLIRPSGGAARTISGEIAAGSPLIDLNGADNVTIDGLNTGGNALTIANTRVSDTSGTSTIRFINGATNNTITNANIQGSGTMGDYYSGGVIYFSTDSVTANGNDNNTLSNNNIGPAGANLPTRAIFGEGTYSTTAIGNSGILITNNNIFDFFNPAATSTGVATNGGCNSWTITDNRFYQTGTRTWTAIARNRAIDIGDGLSTPRAQGFTITGNIIGYASATQTGTYTLTGSLGMFQAIFFKGISGGTVSNINANTIAAVRVSGVTSNGTGGTSTPFGGILVSSGVVNTNYNTIGSQSATGSLIFSTTTTNATDVFGIYNFSSNRWTAIGNNIGGISVTNATNAAAPGPFVIYALRVLASSSVNFTAVSNNIGGTVADSIQLNATGASSQVVGLQTNAQSVLVSNTIRNLTTNIGTGTGNTASVIGVNITTSSTANHTLSQNTISKLTNSHATGASVVTGIEFTGGAASVVEKNLITGLAVATTSATAQVNGIRVAGGTTTYRNNMINLGDEISNAIGGAATNSSAVGIVGINEAAGTNNFFHNSVYIRGAAAAGSGASYAFLSIPTTGSRSFRNNILLNARTNSGATGKHYAIKLNGTAPNPTGLTINNNVYFANGSGAALGFFNSADVAGLSAWQAAVGQDANSIEADPLYVSATNLNLQPGSPASDQASDLGVTNDFAGKSRPGANALFDIGADEGDGIRQAANDMQATAFLAPTNNELRPAGVSFSPQASFTNNGTAEQTNVTVRYRIVNAALVEIYNQTATIASILTFPFAIANVTFPSVAIGTPGTYAIYAQSELGTDAAPENDVIIGTLVIRSPLAGTYTVGSGGSYPSLTNAGGIFQELNILGASANLTLDIISDLSNESGAHALNQIAGGYAVLIRPSGAPRTITGTGASTTLIKLNGADQVTIDGSLSGGTDRSLTIVNPNTANNTTVVMIGSLGAGAGATDNTVKNSVIRAGTVSGTIVTYGIFVGHTNGTLNGPNNHNLTIENNDIARAGIGIQAIGGTNAGEQNNALQIVGNTLGDADPTNSLFRTGMTVSYAANAVIRQNYVQNVIGTNNTIIDFNNTRGIYISTGVTNSTVERNSIMGIRYAGTQGYGGKGLDINTGVSASNLTIANNVISDITGSGSNSGVINGIAGIRIWGTTGGINLYYNSVNLGSGNFAGASTSTQSAALMIANTVTNLDIRNNIFATNLNNTSAAGAKSYAIFSAATSAANLTMINYNAYFASGAQGVLGRLNNVDRLTLGDWQTATAKDASSISADPRFVSPTDLHIFSAASPAANAGTPIAGITTDFDGQARDGSAPEIGADEGVTTVCPLSGTYNYDVSAPDPCVVTADAVINGRLNAAGALTVNSGATLHMGANELNVAGVLTNNGRIERSRNVSGAGFVAFFNTGSYGGVRIDPGSSLPLGATTVAISRSAGDSCTTGGQLTARRCFTLSPANPTGRNATLRFYFDETTDLPAGLACADLRVYHDDGGGAWSLAGNAGGAPTCAGANSYVEVTNVTTFSAFALAGAKAPTAVSLAAFTGSSPATAAGPLLAWLAVLAAGGFALYRRLLLGR